MKDNELITAHQLSINNKEELIKGKKCGCFYCLKIFNSNEIKEWIEDKRGTALCPYCNIDAVIVENPNQPLTKEYLERMKDYWF